MEVGAASVCKSGTRARWKRVQFWTPGSASIRNCINDIEALELIIPKSQKLLRAERPYCRIKHNDCFLNQDTTPSYLLSSISLRNNHEKLIQGIVSNQ